MTTTTETCSVTVRHQALVAASPDDVYALVADTEAAPRFFPPQVHSEVVDRYPGGDVVRRWVNAGGGLRAWNARREFDPAARRIVFAHQDPEPPLREQRGEWSFTPGPDGGTVIDLVHTVVADDQAVADRIAADLDRTGPMQLAGYRKVAEAGARRHDLVVDAVRAVRLDIDPDRAYAVLAALATGDPERMVGIPRPPDRVVFKATDLPSWLGARLGVWTVAACGTGAEVRLHHVATLGWAALGADLGGPRARAALLLADDLDRTVAAIRAAAGGTTR